ncbi:hypothetical protein [Deinococcus hopiensis]|nr:hypothetical protein [Deinococcus hopiensis]
MMRRKNWFVGLTLLLSACGLNVIPEASPSLILNISNGDKFNFSSQGVLMNDFVLVKALPKNEDLRRSAVSGHFILNGKAVPASLDGDILQANLGSCWSGPGVGSSVLNYTYLDAQGAPLESGEVHIEALVCAVSPESAATEVMINAYSPDLLQGKGQVQLTANAFDPLGPTELVISGPHAEVLATSKNSSATFTLALPDILGKDKPLTYTATARNAAGQITTASITIKVPGSVSF